MSSTNATKYRAQFRAIRGMLKLVEVLESEDASTVSWSNLLLNMGWFLRTSPICFGLRISYRGFHLCPVGGEEFLSLRFKSHHQNRLGVGCAD